jgi:nitronate monooxygenase
MATISTKLTTLLGIEHPVVQGGMGWVGCELPAAVSNAGGLGMICAGSHAQAGGIEGLRLLIRKCKQLTNNPFGVNFLLLSGGNDWMATAKVIIEENVPVVETAGRPPPKELLAMFKTAGVIIIHKCVTIRHALAAERSGVDVVEVAGFDLGGHPGEKDVGNWILLAKAGQKLRLPWIAAGGCATGAQLAAAIALGASGINMGTRFLATKECAVAAGIKQAILQGSEEDTALLMRG